MKKIILTMFTTLLLLITGCDNNDGPFEIRLEEGKKILYSGEKLAKGWVKNTIYNPEKNANVVVYEMYFDDGVPAGDFRLYNDEGELVVDGKGKWTNDGFKGTIKEPLSNGKGKGTFSINPSFLVSFNGENYYNFSYETLIDGEYSGDDAIFAKKNNEYEGEFLKYNTEGKLIIKANYIDGKREGEYLEYTPGGSLLVIKAHYKNGELDGKYFEYHLGTGELIFEIDYKEGKYNGRYKTYNFRNGALEEDIEYKNGIREGKYFRYVGYLTNNYLIEEGTYKNGKRDGIWKNYDYQGNISYTDEYKDGKFIR